MKAKVISVVLLSALLILSIPKQNTPVNKSTQRTKVQTVQAKLTEKQPQAKVEDKALTEPQASVEPATTRAEIARVVTPPTDHEQLMNQAGIQPEDYGAADYIISHESSWRDSATEPTSGAFGLCQSLPAIKMASAGSDWQTNPVTQLKWCNQYAQTRYGGWQGAYSHWLSFRWW